MSARPIPDGLRDRLRELVVEIGERSASRRLNLSRQTISRVLAGLGCYPGTEAQLDRALRQIGRVP